jgi:signal transduction histidine kinase
MDTHETTVYNGILITAMVLGGCIFAFAFYVIRQQRHFVRMLRLRFTYEINLLENERSRMSADLHDDVGPLLTIIKNHLSQMKAHDPHDALHRQKASGYLRELTKQMGEIAANLAPHSLQQKGLQFALTEFFSDQQEVCTQRLFLRYELKKEPAPEKALPVFRIIQELAHNCIKHSQAQTFYVHLRERKKKLYIFCKDDGIGFDIQAIREKQKGMGLGTLKSRTELLNGHMKFKSAPQKGTEYFFELPINEP